MPYPFLLEDYEFKDIYYSKTSAINTVNVLELPRRFDGIISCHKQDDQVTIVLVRKGRNGVWFNKDQILVNGNGPYEVLFFDTYDADDKGTYSDMCVVNALVDSEHCELSLNGDLHQLCGFRSPPSSPMDLVAMTLFKYDAHLIPTYVEHYKKLGVVHFWLYYNDDISKMAELPKIDGVTYVPWPYPYKVKGMHHAQSGAMTDMLHFSRRFAKYVLFNDLDEYIIWRPKNVTFKDFIVNSGFDTYGILNNFTFFHDAIDKALEHGKYTRTFQMEFTHRSKMIVNPSKHNFLGIHKPMNACHTLGNILVLAGPTCEMLHACNLPGRKHVSVIDAKLSRLSEIKNMILSI
jgi:hypothetical protein